LNDFIGSDLWTCVQNTAFLIKAIYNVLYVIPQNIFP